MPFPFEGPVPPQLLIDRTDELDLLARRLADQGHLVRHPRATTLVDPLLAEWLRRR
jgi:hypothetical protein